MADMFFYKNYGYMGTQDSEGVWVIDIYRDVTQKGPIDEPGMYYYERIDLEEYPRGIRLIDNGGTYDHDHIRLLIDNLIFKKELK